jgi:sec-independent protein translocase protein TatC
MDDLDPIDRAKKALTDRADLPGMSLMEHLDELRKRLMHVVGWLFAGVVVAYFFRIKLIDLLQRPLTDIHLSMTMTHPLDAVDLWIYTSLVGGIILSSPFVLYQLWLFISPGMYANEKKYVVPFMLTTVGLFLSGAWFGYRYVLPGAMVVLIQDIGKNLTKMITVDDYTHFFLSVILGLALCFELPVLMFFLSLLGIADGKFFLRQYRYAILVIFLISAVICPMPDPVSMCLFATPMLILYCVGVGVAFYVHPDSRKARADKAA